MVLEDVCVCYIIDTTETIHIIKMYMIIHKNTLTTRYSCIFRIIVTRIHIKQQVYTVHMDTYVYFVSRNVEIIHTTTHNTQYTDTVHVCTLHVNPMFSWYLTRYTGRYYTYRNNLKQSIINGLNITK